MHFELRDYREQAGTFDRIVSVGMFEHVGVDALPRVLPLVRSLLSGRGRRVLHSIGRMDGPGTTNPWIRKYIFPGGYAPALSEVLPVVERLGLWVTDIEILRLHCAETLRAWRRRFAPTAPRSPGSTTSASAGVEFYLVASEPPSRMGHMVFQMQLARRQDAVPLTRDYLTDWERRRLDGAIAAE